MVDWDFPVVGAGGVVLRVEDELGALFDAGGGGCGVAEALVADYYTDLYTAECVDCEVLARCIGYGI